MSKRDRGIAGDSRREVLEGAQGVPPPFFSLILRGVPHNMSRLCGFSWADTSRSRPEVSRATEHA
jgi:hypothetical protein